MRQHQISRTLSTCVHCSIKYTSGTHTLAARSAGQSQPFASGRMSTALGALTTHCVRCSRNVHGPMRAQRNKRRPERAKKRRENVFKDKRGGRGGGDGNSDRRNRRKEHMSGNNGGAERRKKRKSPTQHNIQTLASSSRIRSATLRSLFSSALRVFSFPLRSLFHFEFAFPPLFWRNACVHETTLDDDLAEKKNCTRNDGHQQKRTERNSKMGKRIIYGSASRVYIWMCVHRARGIPATMTVG